jgi:hypothetical protein
MMLGIDLGLRDVLGDILEDICTSLCISPPLALEVSSSGISIQ